MHTCHIVALIVWIMYKHQIRSMLFKIIIPIPGHRDIVRILIAFVVLFFKASVRISVIVRNGNYISIAVRIFLRGLPDALQRIPHGCFIWKEHSLRPYFNIVFNTVLNLNQGPVQILICFSGIYLFTLAKLFIELIDGLAVSLQQCDGHETFPFCLLDRLAQIDCALLALAQKIHGSVLFSRFYGHPDPIMYSIKQPDQLFCLFFLRFFHWFSFELHYYIIINIYFRTIGISTGT